MNETMSSYEIYYVRTKDSVKPYIKEVTFTFRHSSKMVDGHSNRTAYKKLWKYLWESYGLNITITSNVDTGSMTICFKNEEDYLSFMMANA